MKKRFSKESRLLKPYQFQRVIREGRSFVGKYIIAHLFFGKSEKPKLGLTVSKRFGKAYQRSRFKRLSREAFRSLHHQLPPFLEIHIRPKASLFSTKMQEIQQELLSSIQHVS